VFPEASASTVAEVVAAAVVTITVSLAGDTASAASTAYTVYEYSVDGVSPVSVYVVPVTLAIRVPFR
jgi:hypothetical protein